MKRRTLLRVAASAVAVRPFAWLRASAQPALLPPDALATLRDAALVILPSELGRKGADAVVNRFERWLRGYKAGAEVDPGYGFTRLRSTGPHPGTRYATQLAALAADASRRGGALSALPPDAHRETIQAALAAAKVDRMPGRPDGGHVITDLMAFFFHSTEANDLCYRARIGRDICRALPGSDRPPARLT